MVLCNPGALPGWSRRGLQPSGAAGACMTNTPAENLVEIVASCVLVPSVALSGCCLASLVYGYVAACQRSEGATMQANHIIFCASSARLCDILV